MKIHAFRLTRGMDLKKEILNFSIKNNIKAGGILTCVGHLTRATIRMADASIIKDFEEEFEIVSLVGTISREDVHLHISISNKDGNTFGGHLKDNCLVGVTAEIIIGEFSGLEFFREFDEKTGYNELIVKKL